MNKLNTPAIPCPVIIGAGPAGINAAITLAEHGINSIVLDENIAPGGAIFRQPSKNTRLGHSPVLDKKTRDRANTMLAKLHQYQDKITVYERTQVLGELGKNHSIMVLNNNKVAELRYRALIVCTGCYERSQPFPGWTLPGVMSVGGMQLQVKSNLVRPGHRVVLTGTGPLLLVAAKQLHEAGMTVVGVYEAGKKSELYSELPALLADIPLLFDGLKYLNYLKKNNIPVYYGWGIVEARGINEVSKVVVAPYDKQWRPKRNKHQILDADSLAVNYGFTSRTQLTQQLGCKHSYHHSRGGIKAEIDEWHHTSRKEIYTAGDANGIYGSYVAEVEGKIAAYSYLRDNGNIDQTQAEQVCTPLRNQLKRLLKFQHGFSQLSTPKEGLLTLPDQETVICRCEHVTLEKIDQAIAQGIVDITKLKMATRAGMGDCQGKNCADFCRDYLSQKTQLDHYEVGKLNPRFPLAPVTFGAFLGEENGA